MSSTLEGLFGQGLRIKAKMILKEGAQPVFLKARPIPYSLREKVEKEFDRLQKDGSLVG